MIYAPVPATNAWVKMSQYLYQIAQQICLSFPESEEFVSHGAPNFRVKKGKIFAVYAQNLHGGKRIALWLNSPAGAQAAWVEPRPRGEINNSDYFVPPYVGPRGWLGVRLDRDVAFSHIHDLVREAYVNTAPKKWHALIGTMPALGPPESAVAAEAEQSRLDDALRKILTPLREICLALPECNEQSQYGYPIWRAGAKTFAQLLIGSARTGIGFWADGQTQSMLLDDPRYYLPPYIGHRGWIALDLRYDFDWAEIREHVLQSYRHFALQRMRLALDHKRS